MARIPIFVVEDEYIVAKDVESRLTGLGYDVVGVAGNGEEAVEQIPLKTPRLVLMDIMLKGRIDGIAAAEQIRNLYDVPVVFLTAYADEDTLRRAQVTDAFGYLLKPFEEREMHITIEMALYKHRLEMDLRESRRRLDTILRSIGDAVIAADLEGEVTFMNPVAEDLTGWREPEARGKKLWEIFRVSGGSARHTLREILPRLDPGEAPDAGGRAVLQARNGTSILIDENATPIRDDRSRVSGAVVVFRDATERHRAERALRESEERYRAFFEEDITADYIANGEGTILDCNPAFVRILGFPSIEEARGASLHECYPDRDSCTRFLDDLQSNRRLTYYEKDLRSKDGRRVHVIENVTGLFDGRGTLLTYKGYMFDDTIRKQLEEQLHQTQKMDSIGTMASGVAHDFNNVINNVLGFSSQLMKHADDPAKVMKYAQTIEKSATRGAELSAQLLSFARVGRREFTPLNLGLVVEEVAALCSETFPGQISVRREVEPGLHSVLGDHGAMYQVLMNLCVNARDALALRDESGGGTIRIKARNAVAVDPVSAKVLGGEGTPCVELSVEDTGAGIPREIRDRIFDPFFTTKERGKGTGLGLSVVYNIIRNHHGVLGVESEEGKGSTFRIHLPITREALDKSAGHHLPGQIRGRGETILIVDDEESMRELARDILEEAGYRVLTAGSGNQAVELFRQRSPEIDLVVLDLVMPGLDGGQTYLELKRLKPGLRAFFCTGFMPDHLISTLLNEERLQALRKPFKPDLLIRAVRETLDREGD